MGTNANAIVHDHWAQVFTGEALVRLAARAGVPAGTDLGGLPLAALRGRTLGPAAWQPASALAMLPRHRTEVRGAVRAQVEAQIARARAVLQAGGTLYLTPEGHPSGCGRLLRLRQALAALSPEAPVWLAAIAYDPLRRSGPLPAMVRICRPALPADLTASLAAARPVTRSQAPSQQILAESEDR